MENNYLLCQLGRLHLRPHNLERDNPAGGLPILAELGAMAYRKTAFAQLSAGEISDSFRLAYEGRRRISMYLDGRHSCCLRPSERPRSEY